MFRDRREAGRRLAARLLRRGAFGDVLVLALPRGGVPVARPIADALGAELDVWPVRKLVVPGCRELAMGAISVGGARVENRGVLAALGLAAAPLFEETRQVETAELEREAHAFRGDREGPRVVGRDVVLVDDGVATGATMEVAIRALRQAGAARVVVAVPVAEARALHKLASVADDIIAEVMPEPFGAVARWYRDFADVGDDEIRTLLERGDGRRRNTADLGVH
jgi:putative phosphoribosyl transferase